MTVNKERVKLLVDALRSGEYIQGWNRLSTNDLEGTLRHCCLGVACQIALKNGVELNISEDNLFTGGQALKYNTEYSLLPEKVRDWYGFHSISPLLKAEDRTNIKATMVNDDLGWDFNRIANGFERMYLTDGE